MMQYFYLQLKRLLRIFPMLLIGTLVTLACLALLLGGIGNADKNSADKQRFHIAITGDTSGDYVQMGLMALQTFDDTRFAIDVVELEEEIARQQLLEGKISAYVILPEDFIERALYGDVDTVTYVTHAGGENIVSMFKNEFTQVISDLVIYSQKGVYAIGDVAAQEDVRDVRGKYMDDLAFSYIELIFARNKIYTLQELGIGNGLTLPQYYIGALSVFLLLFVGVAFVSVGVHRDYSLQALLQSKRLGPGKQILWEYCAHFILLLVLSGLLAGGLCVAGSYMNALRLPGFWALMGRFLPVVAMAAALNMLVFELSGNVVSAVLWHFFLCLGQCYVAGCFYPVYSLPPVLQSVSGLLCAGLARDYISGCFLRSENIAALFGLLLFTALFGGLTVLVRWAKLRTGRR